MLMDFEALQHAGKQAEKINEKVTDRFLVAYQQALHTVAELNQQSAQDPLGKLPVARIKAAAEDLLSALTLKPSLPQPYALLSYLFFLMHNLELAVKYLYKAEELDPQFPKLLELKILYAQFIETLEQASQQAESGVFQTAIPRIDPVSRHVLADVEEAFELPDL